MSKNSNWAGLKVSFGSVSLEFDAWRAHKAVVDASGITLLPSADLGAPKGGVASREVPVCHAEGALQFDGVAGAPRTMVCSQSAVASETCVPEISPAEPRISLVPFSTSFPRIRAVVLALTL